MAGDHKKKLAGRKKKRKSASSSVALLPDWKQGDWMPSTMTKEALAKVVADGLLPAEGWRIPGANESEPNLDLDERVPLIPHIE